MSADVSIKGAPEAFKALQNAAKQVRFATAQAANDTAKEVQAFTVNDLLPQKFTLRSKGTPWQKPGNKLGFNIKFANKETLTSTIGSQADFLKLQEEGGTKKTSGRIAVPTSFWKKREEIMRKEKKPRAIAGELDKSDKREAALTASIGSLGGRYAREGRKIAGLYAKEAMARNGGDRRAARQLRVKRHALESKQKQIDAKRQAAVRKLDSAQLSRSQALGSLTNKPFLYSGSSMPEGIYVRTNKERGPLRMLFRFIDSAPIKGRMTFVVSGKKIVEENFSKHFQARWIHAVATAK